MGDENSGGADTIPPENHFLLNRFELSIILFKFDLGGLGTCSPGKIFNYPKRDPQMYNYSHLDKFQQMYNYGKLAKFQQMYQRIDSLPTL